MKKNYYYLTFLFLLLSSLVQAQFAHTWSKNLANETKTGSQTKVIELKLDQQGNSYAVGDLYQTGDFAPGPAILDLTAGYASGQVVWFGKYDTNGNVIFAKAIQGQYVNHATSIAIDDAKNIFVTGYFRNRIDFDPGPGVVQETAFKITAYFAKYDSLGNYVYHRLIGNTTEDNWIRDITVNSQNEVIVCGSFEGVVDFDQGVGVTSLTSAGNRSPFFAKYDNSGSFVYVKSFDAYQDGDVTAIALDPNDDIYLGGIFGGTVDFDPGLGVVAISGGNYGLFFGRYSSAGAYKMAKGLWDTDYGGITDIDVDTNLNIAISGLFYDYRDFDPGAGVVNIGSQGGSDIFIAKYDSLGNYIFAHGIGGSRADAAHAIGFDASGNIFVTGYFSWDVNFNPNGFAMISAHPNRVELFLAKYDPVGNYIVAKYMPGDPIRDNIGAGLAVDGLGQPHIGGEYGHFIDMDPGAGAQNLPQNSQSGFIGKYTSNCDYIWAHPLGTYQSIFYQEEGTDIVRDTAGNLYVTGYFTDTVDFDPGPGVATRISNGLDDAFLAKYDPLGNFVYALTFGATDGDTAHAVAVDPMGNAYITGSFKGAVDFDPGIGTNILTASGTSSDIFVAKIGPTGNLIFAGKIGAFALDVAYDIDLDASNNIYITGCYGNAVDFDMGPGTATLNASGSNAVDIFFAKYSTNGAFVFAKGMAGSSGWYKDDFGRAIDVSPAGTIYLTGTFVETVDFDPSGGVASLTSSGEEDVFVAEYSTTGLFQNVAKIGGNGIDIATGIAADANGNTYVTGYFDDDCDFDPGAGSFNLTPYGGNDGFLVRLDPAFGLDFAIHFGGGAEDLSHDVQTDTDGNAFVTGSFESTANFGPSGGTQTLTSIDYNPDIFLVKYDSLGNYLEGAALGGGGYDKGSAIALGPNEERVLTGYFSKIADFDPGVGVAELTSRNASNVFIAKYNECDNPTDPDLPIVVASASSICAGDSVILSIASGNLNGATDWQWYAGSCGGSPIGNGDSIVVNPQTASAYYARGEGACITPGFCGSVTVLVTASSNTTITQSSCSPITINSQTYTASGTYSQTLTNAAGCDSTLTLNLTIGQPTTGSLSQSGCGSLTINSQTYTASGTYSQTLTNAAGCDSTLTLNLTIGQPTTGSLSQSGCGSLTINSQTYTASGTYSQTLTNAAGCDSTLTLNLTIGQPTTGSLTQSGCGSLTINSQTYTASGTYSQTLTNAAGCDSTLTLNLTIGQPTTGSLTQSGCGSLTINSQTYTASGTYSQTLTNAAGCDSTLTLNLTIGQPTTGSLTQSGCGSLTINSQTYTASGTYSQTLTNAEGCDSTLTLNLTIGQPTSGSLTQSGCGSLTINSQSYTASGTYSQTLTNAAGCDSTLTLNLTIGQPTAGSLTQSGCGNLTINGQTYAASGSYSQTLTNAAGCDSSLTLNLTIGQPTTGSLTQSGCGSLTINSQTYTASGTYSQTLTNGAGCDSTLTLNLAIGQPTSGSLTQSGCGSMTINSQTYTASGTYSQTLTNAAGCDSTLTLNLTIGQPTTGSLSQSGCGSLTINSQTYTANGTYSQTLTNATGCDSTLTLNLTIGQPTTGSLSQSGCGSLTINSQSYTASGTYSQTLTNAAGCDSTLTLNLTIGQPTTGSLTQSGCGSLTINSQTYTASGTYSQTLTNATGCDSILTLNLTIGQPTTGSLTQSGCGSLTINSQTYTASGTYSQTLTNAAGCDSTLTLNLTIGQPTTGSLTQSGCGSLTINSQTYTASGTYSQTLTNATGCDSILTLNLTIGQPTSGSLTQSGCGSMTINSQTYTASGIYSQTLTNAAGCDSTLTLNLTIGQSTTGSLTQSGCGSLMVNGQTYASSGTYSQTLTNAAGCDSTLTLYLTIGPPTNGSLTQSGCGSLTINSQTYTTSGTYSQTLTNAAGCDSILTLNLTIGQESSVTQNVTACEEFTWQGMVYTTSGVYTDSLVNQLGCDSILILNLNVVGIDTAITLNSGVLSSGQSNANYQWINCVNNSPIANATGQSFTPIATGSYAVMVTLNNCTTRTRCVNVTVVDIVEAVINTVEVYPNPNSGRFSIDLGQLNGVKSVQVVNGLGQTIFNEHFKETHFEVELPPCADGVYFVKIAVAGEQVLRKVWVRRQ